MKLVIKKGLLFMFFMVTVLLLYGCSSLDNQVWQSKERVYKINQKQVGDYRDKKVDWDNSTTFKNIYNELSDQYNTFICTTWNYDIIDGKRRYELNETDGIPSKYDYYGQSITVSKNYFDYTSIKDVNGTNIQELLSFDENTIDILVPEKYKNDEKQLVQIYQEYMYFNNVEVDNIYKEKFEEKLNTKEESNFSVNILYVPNDTKYNVYNPYIKYDYIDNCIVIVINSQNLHKVQLYSLATQGMYIYSYDENMENIIKDTYIKNDFEAGYHSLKSVSELYKEYKQESITSFIIISGLCLLVIFFLGGLIFIIRKNRRKI